MSSSSNSAGRQSRIQQHPLAWQSLPDGVCEVVAKHLSAQAVLYCRRVCTSWRDSFSPCITHVNLDARRFVQQQQLPAGDFAAAAVPAVASPLPAAVVTPGQVRSEPAAGLLGFGLACSPRATCMAGPTPALGARPAAQAKARLTQQQQQQQQADSNLCGGNGGDGCSDDGCLCSRGSGLWPVHGATPYECTDDAQSQMRAGSSEGRKRQRLAMPQAHLATSQAPAVPVWHGDGGVRAGSAGDSMRCNRRSGPSADACASSYSTSSSCCLESSEATASGGRAVGWGSAAAAPLQRPQRVGPAAAFPCLSHVTITVTHSLAAAAGACRQRSAPALLAAAAASLAGGLSIQVLELQLSNRRSHRAPALPLSLLPQLQALPHLRRLAVERFSLDHGSLQLLAGLTQVSELSLRGNILDAGILRDMLSSGDGLPLKIQELTLDALLPGVSTGELQRLVHSAFAWRPALRVLRITRRAWPCTYDTYSYALTPMQLCDLSASGGSGAPPLAGAIVSSAEGGVHEWRRTPAASRHDTARRSEQCEDECSCDSGPVAMAAMAAACHVQQQQQQQQVAAVGVCEETHGTVVVAPSYYGGHGATLQDALELYCGCSAVPLMPFGTARGAADAAGRSGGPYAAARQGGPGAAAAAAAAAALGCRAAGPALGGVRGCCSLTSLRYVHLVAVSLFQSPLALQPVQALRQLSGLWLDVLPPDGHTRVDAAVQAEQVAVAASLGGLNLQSLTLGNAARPYLIATQRAAEQLSTLSRLTKLHWYCYDNELVRHQAQDLSALGRLRNLTRLRLHFDSRSETARRTVSSAALPPSLTSLSLRGVLMAPGAAAAVGAGAPTLLPALRQLFLSRTWLMCGRELLRGSGQLRELCLRSGSTLGVRVSELQSMFPELQVLRMRGINHSTWYNSPSSVSGSDAPVATSKPLPPTGPWASLAKLRNLVTLELQLDTDCGEGALCGMSQLLPPQPPPQQGAELGGSDGGNGGRRPALRSLTIAGPIACGPESAPADSGSICSSGTSLRHCGVHALCAALAPLSHLEALSVTLVPCNNNDVGKEDQEQRDDGDDDEADQEQGLQPQAERDATRQRREQLALAAAIEGDRRLRRALPSTNVSVRMALGVQQ